MVRYTHTQPGMVVRGALLVGAGVTAGLSTLIPTPPAILVGAAVVLVGCAYVFSSLTVQVTDERLRWHFGAGFFRREIPLAAILSAEPTRTGWLDGWGIHRGRRGMLYNVSGFQALALTLRDGRRILLGTDEPERLQQALGIGRK